MTAIFCYITQVGGVNLYWLFRPVSSSYLKGQEFFLNLSLEDGTGRLSRNVGTVLPHNSADLLRTWSHNHKYLIKILCYRPLYITFSKWYVAPKFIYQNTLSFLLPCMSKKKTFYTTLTGLITLLALWPLTTLIGVVPHSKPLKVAFYIFIQQI